MPSCGSSRPPSSSRPSACASSAGCGRRSSPGAPTILKDNISWHFPFPGANTTPWQLEGTIRALHAGGYRDLSCVQNKTVVTDAFKGEDLNRYVPILKRYDVPILYNFKDEDMTWIRYQPKARMHVLPKIFPEGIHIPDYFPGKNIVHLPTVKCHIYTTTTGAMKNAFGGLLHTHRHYTHSWIHRTLVDLLAIQKEIHPGIFAVMDGTTAGNGPGPRTMYPVIKNVMLASADQVAIDAVAAKMMGFDPMSIEYIRVAHEDGLGVGDPRDIEIVGDADVGEGVVGLPGRRQPGEPRRRPVLVLAAEGLPEAVLPHADRPPVRVRVRGLPRLLPVAGEGPPHVRAVAPRHGVGPAVPGLRGSPSDPRSTPDADRLTLRRQREGDSDLAIAATPIPSPRPPA